MTKSDIQHVRKDSEIEKLIECWQTVLNLKHWRFRISEKKPKKGNAAEAHLNRKRQLASLRFSDDAKALNDDEFEAMIAHELLHVVMDLVDEEFHLQEKEGIINRDRFVRAEEKVIEHLSYVLLNLTRP